VRKAEERCQQTEEQLRQGVNARPANRPTPFEENPDPLDLGPAEVDPASIAAGDGAKNANPGNKDGNRKRSNGSWIDSTT
jgi:hypothetical protein